MAQSGGLERLAGPWRVRVDPASRRALASGLVAATLALAHLARLGTSAGRATAGAVLGALILAGAGWVIHDRRSWRSRRISIGRVLRPVDHALAARAERAVTLADRAGEAGFRGSTDLARHHLDRLLARASVEAVAQGADHRARRWRQAALGCWLVAVLALLPGPLRVAEGLNVGLAWRGRAPFTMSWMVDARITARAPAYLQLTDREIVPGASIDTPAGTVITVRGIPARPDRHLVLTDGQRDVPFVADGSGGVVARWEVDRSATLHVAARFGEVLVHAAPPMEVTARPDEPPVVELEGAPRTVQLRDVERLKLLYSAADDHGLRQVDLVLRSGTHEDRRLLLRLSGGTTLERGGTALTSQDPFLRRMFLPVVVTVEARDNDPLTGPKWGRSRAVTIVPPAVGAPEADRFVALCRARDLIIDWLAAQLAARDAPDRPRDDRRIGDEAVRGMRAAVAQTYGGLTVPDGLQSFLNGQLRVAVGRPPPGASAVRRTEDVVLAVDVALHALADRDARNVARRLAAVGEEAADGARQARETEQREVGVARLDAAIAALHAGGNELLRIGPLGADLGSVVQSDLGRIRRARSRDDLAHAELAARHLAARLRRPEPSTAPVRGGGTEMAGLGGPAAWGAPSHANRLFDELQAELAELAEEHAREIETVERTLTEAQQAADLQPVEEAARRRAEALRRSVTGLPLPGANPGSTRATAALAREHAESMAQSLERLHLDEAAQSGREALTAVEDAQRQSRDPATGLDWVDGAALRAVHRRLSADLEWVNQVLVRLGGEARARAAGALRKSGGREQDLSGRAGNLAARGRISETALPDDTVEDLDRAGSLMREAAQALLDGRGERGIDLQREAQRLLMRSDRGSSRGEDAPRSAESPPTSGRRRGLRTEGTVPDSTSSGSADEFRRRVIDGLGQDHGGRLAPAIKRYAEGLLR